jgi:uncharacterized protein
MSQAARVDSVDQLRAFALLGICAVNMPFIAAPILTGPPVLSGLDHVATFAIAWLCAGKFFLIFAFLFGWSFGVQQVSAARAGRSFHVSFLRRSLGLLLIGSAHALLVFAGDILIPYAIMGMLLLLAGRLRAQSLVRLALATIPIAAVLLMVLAGMIASMPLEAESASGYLAGVGPAIAQRFADWQLAFPFILMTNGPLIFGAFCLGLAAHRSGFFTPGHAVYERLRRNIGKWWTAGLLLNLPFAAAATGLIDGAPAALSFMLLAVAAPVLTTTFVVTVSEVARGGRLPRAFGCGGRMSLTAYVAEGVLGSLFFLGLGLFDTMGMAAITGCAIIIFLVVELACAAWLRRNRQGPLEAVLRAITSASLPGLSRS